MRKLLLGAALVLGFAGIITPRMGVHAEQPSGNTCNKSQIYDASTSGATQIVAPGNPILICGYSFLASGTVNVGLVYGTGTNCATGQTKITPAYQFTAQTGMSDNSPFFRGMNALANTGLCINTNGAVAVQAVVYYYQ